MKFSLCKAFNKLSSKNIGLLVESFSVESHLN